MVESGNREGTRHSERPANSVPRPHPPHHRRRQRHQKSARLLPRAQATTATPIHDYRGDFLKQICRDLIPKTLEGRHNKDDPPHAFRSANDGQ